MIATLLLAAALSVNEQSFVKIGGIDQWVTIHGADRNNPVVLFLHGGPGDAYTPYAESMFSGWEKELTLVQWDQRGAGRTYAKNGPSIESTMTVDRMVGDAIEVAEYVTKHLHQKKVILVGGSWGSMLGIEVAHRRPDLLIAYVGEAQMVGWRRNVAGSYERVLQLARAANDQQSIATLTEIGPPPWDSIRKWPRFRKIQTAYEEKQVTAAPAPIHRSADYDSPEERAKDAEADDFSFLHFIGMTMSGPETTIDLPSLGTKFSVPVTFIQGEEDLVALPSIAKAYFDSIEAPHKDYYLVRGSGHEPTATTLATLHRVLRKIASE